MLKHWRHKMPLWTQISLNSPVLLHLCSLRHFARENDYLLAGESTSFPQSRSRSCTALWPGHGRTRQSETQNKLHQYCYYHISTGSKSFSITRPAWDQPSQTSHGKAGNIRLPSCQIALFSQAKGNFCFQRSEKEIAWEAGISILIMKCTSIQFYSSRTEEL